jgi:predicted deacylase
MDISIDKINVTSGSKKFAALKVGKLPDGTDILVPIVVINGVSKGPTLVVCAGIHGDEVNGIEACFQLSRTIEPGQVRGKLILLPICNPLAFNARLRCTPIDNKDLNRCFPGDKGGSITHKIAYALFESVFKKAGYIIDLHSGPDHLRLVPHTRTFETDLDCTDIAKAFGLRFIIMRKGDNNSIASTALKENIKSIVVEIGEGNRLEEEYVNIGILGVKRVMSHLRMAKGQQTLPTPSIILNERIYVRTPHGGILVPLKKEGEKVSKGEKIAEVHNPYSEEIKTIKAPANGFVLGIRKSPQVFTGDGAVLIYR